MSGSKVRSVEEKRLQERYPWITEETVDKVMEKIQYSDEQQGFSQQNVMSLMGSEEVTKILVASRIDIVFRVLTWLFVFVQLYFMLIILIRGDQSIPRLMTATSLLSSVSFYLMILALGNRLYVFEKREWIPQYIKLNTLIYVPVLLITTLIPVFSVPVLIYLAFTSILWKREFGGIPDKVDRSLVSFLLLIGVSMYILTWLVELITGVRVVLIVITLLLFFYVGLSFLRRRL